LAVALHGVGVVQAAQRLGGGFHLVALQQVDGHQHFFQPGHRLAGGQGFFRETGQKLAAHVQEAVQLVGGVRAVVPEVRRGVGAPGRAGVSVGDEHVALGQRLGHDGF
jgi:hypothetical protein